MTNNPPKIYPFYTITQLANIFGMTRLGARNFLFRMKLPYQFIGNKIIFYLSDIQNHQPTLFASILEANHLNHLIQSQPVEQDDFATKEQFK